MWLIKHSAERMGLLRDPCGGDPCKTNYPPSVAARRESFQIKKGFKLRFDPFFIWKSPDKAGG
jgi:hypothetical protein